LATEKFVDLCKVEKKKYFQKRLDTFFQKVFHRQKKFFYFFAFDFQGFPHIPQSFPQPEKPQKSLSRPNFPFCHFYIFLPKIKIYN